MGRRDGEYEEYHPYGTTSWWATNGSTEVSAKRYRYTGKERDEETGLGYHGARYYAAWLGRWERPDPAGMVDGPNRYAYCQSSPTCGHDLTGTNSENASEDDAMRAADRFPSTSRFDDSGQATFPSGVGARVPDPSTLSTPLTRRQRLDMIDRIASDDPTSRLQIASGSSAAFERRAIRYLRSLVLHDDLAAQLVRAIQSDPSHTVTIESTLEKSAGGVAPKSWHGATSPGLGTESTLRMHERLGPLRGRTFESNSWSDMVNDQRLSNEEPASEGVYRSRRPSKVSDSWTSSVLVASTSSWLYHELTHARNNQLGRNLAQVDAGGKLSLKFDATGASDRGRSAILAEEQRTTTSENLYRLRVGIKDLRPLPVPQ